MAFTLDNFVRSTLQADVTAGATTVTVTKAAPPLRDPPDATVDAPGLLVLQDTPTSPTKIEVISYTGRSIVGTVVTLTGVTRGLEGTTASPWSAGTPTFQGITAGVIAEKLDASGTAAKATTLETARTIALGGLLGGSVEFDGSGDVTITATMADGALSIAKIAGLQTALNTKVNAASLAAVATSGAYGDLSGKPTLGSAAAQNTSAFATAAQGAAADAALPSSGGTITGVTRVTGQSLFYIRGGTDARITLEDNAGTRRGAISCSPTAGTLAINQFATDGSTLYSSVTLSSGQVDVAGALVVGGGKKISKVTLSNAAPGTLADGELYLQY